MCDVLGYKRRGELLCEACAVELAQALDIPLTDGDVYNTPQFTPVFAGDDNGKRLTCADCGNRLPITTAA